jgi:hypothetical protein
MLRHPSGLRSFHRSANVQIQGEIMRSELVFTANKIIGNRYMLCRITSRTVRTCHFLSETTKDAIVDALTMIATPAILQESAATRTIESPIA